MLMLILMRKMQYAHEERFLFCCHLCPCGHNKCNRCLMKKVVSKNIYHSPTSLMKKQYHVTMLLNEAYRTKA